MPTTATDNRSAAVDSVVDRLTDRYRSNPHPNPRSTLTPQQHQAGVGFYGTRPEHTGDAHEVAAVLAGTKAAAQVSGDFFGSSPIGRRMQARLLAAGHTVSSQGSAVVVARNPVRYSKATGVTYEIAISW